MSKSPYSRLLHARKSAFAKYLKNSSRKAWKRYLRLEKVPAFRLPRGNRR